MRIVEDNQFRAVVLKAIEHREFRERLGVHQSDLTYCLNKQALRRLHPADVNDADLLLYSLGYSTQRWLTGQDVDLPEKEVDGIIVTLDAEYDYCPWELKASFQSSTRPVEENLAWIKQIMAQCYVKETTTARLTRLEIMGNWKSIYGKKIKDEQGNVTSDEKDLPENRKPTLSAWRFDFTQDELDKNWVWLKDRRDKFQEILKTGILLLKIVAIPSGQEWECDRCNYQGNLCKEN